MSVLKRLERPSRLCRVAGSLLLVACLPGPVWAGDRDGDGLSDNREALGIHLINNTTLAGGSHPAGSTTYLPPCRPGDPGRVYCVDTDTPDLFVILHPLESGSRFPVLTSALSLDRYFSELSHTRDRGGLGITVHPLTQDPVPANRTRTVTAEGTMAVRVTESDRSLTLPIDDSGNLIFGYSSLGGTPMRDASVSVHTVRIRQYLCHTCGGTPDAEGNCAGGALGTSDCRSSTGIGATGDDLVEEYTRYIMQHEIGHALSLPEHTDAGSAADGFVMTQTIKTEKKGGQVIFHMPVRFCLACQDSFRLH